MWIRGGFLALLKIHVDVDYLQDYGLCVHELFMQYKYPEGSENERRSLLKGIKQQVQEVEEVEFEIPQAKYNYGDSVVFMVKASTKERQHRVRGRIVCEAITYTGM